MAIGIMARSGGIQGMVDWISRYADGPVRTQLCAWLVGLLIFFDDYTNCVVVGSTMRPLTDRNRVSREKLAYIVDSTAAPVAGISVFSTWIAYEVSMFAPQLPEVTKPDGSPYAVADGFAVFIETLPLRFYCLFTLALVAMTVLMRREFGPMHKAERRARLEGKPSADDARPMSDGGLEDARPRDGSPQRGSNALVPVLLMMAVTLALTAATSACFSTMSQKNTARSGEAVSMVSSDTFGFQESGTSIEIAVAASSGILKTPACRSLASRNVSPIVSRSRRMKPFPRALPNPELRPPASRGSRFSSVAGPSHSRTGRLGMLNEKLTLPSYAAATR